MLRRRVAGVYNYRLDGMGDLLCRAEGAAVLDVGCNRGAVAYDFVLNGAQLVHGCDIDEPCITAAREWYSDLRRVKHQFEVIDLRGGAASLSPFGEQRYDFVLLLATYHKLKRVMPAEDLAGLVRELGRRTMRYFAWRGTSDKRTENQLEMAQLDIDLGAEGLTRVQTSYLSKELDLAAAWERLE